MVTKKITTGDDKIYQALNELRHASEVVMEKPVNTNALDKILRNNNIIAISNGRQIILKKKTDEKFNLYKKRLW